MPKNHLPLSGDELIAEGYRLINDGKHVLQLPSGKRVKAMEPVTVGLSQHRAFRVADWIREDRDTEGHIQQLRKEIAADKRQRQTGPLHHRKRRDQADPRGLIGKEFTTPGKQGI